MYKNKGRFIKYTNIIYLLFFLQCCFLIFFQFFIPNIGEIDIAIFHDASNIDSRIVSITPPTTTNNYYLIIYEQTPDSNWLYFTDSSLASPNNLDIIEKFIPDDYQSFIFIKGDNPSANISFSIMSKYPLSYMSTIEHIFHVEYIVPIEFFLLPTFYYSKHYVFFVDPIL